MRTLPDIAVGRGYIVELPAMGNTDHHKIVGLQLFYFSFESLNLCHKNLKTGLGSERQKDIVFSISCKNFSIWCIVQNSKSSVQGHLSRRRAMGEIAAMHVREGNRGDKMYTFEYSRLLSSQ